MAAAPQSVWSRIRTWPPFSLHRVTTYVRRCVLVWSVAGRTERTNGRAPFRLRIQTWRLRPILVEDKRLACHEDKDLAPIQVEDAQTWRLRRGGGKPQPKARAAAGRAGKTQSSLQVGACELCCQASVVKPDVCAKARPSMRWGGGRQHPTRYPTTYQPLCITTRHQKPAIFTISTIPPFPESARHSLPVLTIFTIPRLARQYQPLCTRHFRHSHPSPPSRHYQPFRHSPPTTTPSVSILNQLPNIPNATLFCRVDRGNGTPQSAKPLNPFLDPITPPPPPRIAQAKKKNP